MSKKVIKQRPTAVHICWECKRVVPHNDLDVSAWNRCSKCSKEHQAWQGGIVTKQELVRGTDPEDKVVARKGKSVVYGRDMLQPTVDGHPNQKFLDRYGDGVLKGGRSQLDGQGNEAKTC